MKVSIIVPCYNCEKTLQRTVDSIEKQTYSDIELVLVNDGSSDGTAELIDEIKKNSRFEVVGINQQNGGVSVARNTGIANATGEYIAFIDADDTVNPDFVKLLVEGMEQEGTDTAFCYLSRSLDTVNSGADVGTGQTQVKNQSEFMSTLMYEKFRINFYNFIYRKSKIEEFELCFPVGLKTGEDLEFLWKYLSHCKTACLISKCLYWYYNNPGSAVHRVEWNRVDSYASIERIKKVMDDCGCEFAEEYYTYTSARYLWSYAKTFSVGRRRDLFDRLGTEFDVKAAMKFLIKNCPDVKVRITSRIYLLNAGLFYGFISLAGRF